MVLAKNSSAGSQRRAEILLDSDRFSCEHRPAVFASLRRSLNVLHCLCMANGESG